MRPEYGDFILEQEKKARRKKRIWICAVVLILIFFAAGAAFLLFKNRDKLFNREAMGNAEDTEQEVFYSQEELDEVVTKAVRSARIEASAETLDEIKQYLTDGMSAVEAFRAVYKNDLVVAADGRYHFIPIREDLEHNDYTTANLQVLETGEFQYVEEGQVTSHKGIDVSRFQGEIDWEAVAADGVEFAIIRVGNRGYGTGEIVDDGQFENNMQGANAAGVKAGVYIFSQAINEQEVLEEANYVLEKIAPYQIDCPVVFDLEMIAGDKGRADSLTPEERTRFMKLFCDTIANAGYKPMIYMNLEMAALRCNLEELESYDKWFAYYNPELYFPYKYSLWQYSESGRVAGINGAVDLNICFEPIW